MTVLITGANGFLGSHIKRSWENRGHETIEIGRSAQNQIQCDLSNEIPVLPKVIDYVIHSAGKAHVVPKNEAERNAFHEVNVTGTKNLLNALDKLEKKPKGLLFVSSASVYGRQTGKLLKENSELNAQDPYGKSKVLGEQMVTEWGIENEVLIAIIRPPLIIGKNAPGNLKQMIDAIKKGKYRNIDKGKARRSMVFAEDIADFSPSLLSQGGIYNVTDGIDPSFNELSAVIGDKLGVKIYNLPLVLAKPLALTGDVLGKCFGREMPFSSQKLLKMTNDLTLDSSAAKNIGWMPKSVLAHPDLWL